MAKKIEFPNVFGRWIPAFLLIVIGGMVAFWFLGNAFFGMPQAEEVAKVGAQTEGAQGEVASDDNSEAANTVQGAGILDELGGDLVAAISKIDFIESQRYEDEDYGFGVDYPKSWSYKIFDYDDQRIICMYDSEEGEDCLAIISIDINADQDDIYSEVRELFMEKHMIVEKTMNVEGLGEVQMMEVEDSEDFSKFSFFTKGDSVYGVQAVVSAEEVFDALLSSIKFEE